jgi:uncharacterized protein (TIGR00106 family)
MLVELSINPLGRGSHISSDLASILKLIDDSGLRYVLTPFGTCIEGEWDEVMPLIKTCHEQARKLSPHVMTTIRIEDEQGATDKLHENIASVERAAGRELRRLSQVWTKEAAS